MSAELVPEMDTTEALPWVRDMQGLTERIIELIAFSGRPSEAMSAWSSI